MNTAEFNFMRTHRKYQEIESGLPPRFDSRLPGGALIKRPSCRCWQKRWRASSTLRH